MIQGDKTFTPSLRSIARKMKRHLGEGVEFYEQTSLQKGSGKPYKELVVAHKDGNVFEKKVLPRLLDMFFDGNMTDNKPDKISRIIPAVYKKNVHITMPQDMNAIKGNGSIFQKLA
jgi:hypothetical protein